MDLVRDTSTYRDDHLCQLILIPALQALEAWVSLGAIKYENLSRDSYVEFAL